MPEGRPLANMGVARCNRAKPHILCYMLLRFFLYFDNQIFMANEKHTGLDFDGTVTDVEREALPYSVGYKQDIVQHLGVSEGELEGMWTKAAGEIQASPGKFGWREG